MKNILIGFAVGVLVAGGIFGLMVRNLKAKDRSVSDELVRLEKRIDAHEQALNQIINFLNQATQPK